MRKLIKKKLINWLLSLLGLKTMNILHSNIETLFNNNILNAFTQTYTNTKIQVSKDSNLLKIVLDIYLGTDYITISIEAGQPLQVNFIDTNIKSIFKLGNVTHSLANAIQPHTDIINKYFFTAVDRNMN